MTGLWHDIQEVGKINKPSRSAPILTRYSNTSVRHLSVWIMSCRVTILACFKSFSRDTARRRRERIKTHFGDPRTAARPALTCECFTSQPRVCFRTFSDGCAGRPLLMLQPDLFQSHEVVRQLAPPLEHCGVRPLQETRSTSRKTGLNRVSFYYVLSVGLALLISPLPVCPA